jgi:hypothetical protein
MSDAPVRETPLIISYYSISSLSEVHVLIYTIAFQVSAAGQNAIRRAFAGFRKRINDVLDKTEKRWIASNPSLPRALYLIGRTVPIVTAFVLAFSRLPEKLIGGDGDTEDDVDKVVDSVLTDIESDA